MSLDQSTITVASVEELRNLRDAAQGIVTMIDMLLGLRSQVISPAHCLKCGHDWKPHSALREPKRCPKCHSSTWKVARNPLRSVLDQINSTSVDAVMREFGGKGMPPPPPGLRPTLVVDNPPIQADDEPSKGE